MKPVVSACYAQFRVDAGGKRIRAFRPLPHAGPVRPYGPGGNVYPLPGARRELTAEPRHTPVRGGSGRERDRGGPCACGFRAPANGMADPTLSSWRPVLVRGRTPLAGISARVRNGLGTCSAVHRPHVGRNAVCRCSLPCVGRVDRGTTRRRSGRSGAVIAF